MTTRLGLNIDHVATVREARKASEPDPVQAAAIAELAGVHGITVHLRHDRRHISERDVELLQRTVKTRLNVEMAPTTEMLTVMRRLRPFMCTLVPETPEEITTTGGLDVRANVEAVRRALGELQGAGIRVSIFIDVDQEQISTAHELGCSMIEINTGPYADLTPADLDSAGPAAWEECERVKAAAAYAASLDMTVLAGHGLNYRNVAPVAGIAQIEELNIGHNIIARAVLVGLDTAVREMLVLLA
ncbi:MAG: pyridoxine 5'-phosphate synthase [Acidobacteria bacterium]|nr:pyridoxine 5'-phosphate synthase [Acidobacteriota bacterium]